LGLLPWSPLAGGWLTGKYQRDQRPTGATRLGENPQRGMEAYDRRQTEQTWNVIDAVQRIAEGREVSMAEVALSWLTHRSGVTASIIGARTVEQLQSNLASAELVLTPEETAELDAVSAPVVGDYPYGELGVAQQGRKLVGGR
jgi:aryl-alcohol dehydrogenase-like predicted oxidoreductase